VEKTYKLGLNRRFFFCGEQIRFRVTISIALMVGNVGFIRFREVREDSRRKGQ
jgi:hypothetical protein